MVQAPTISTIIRQSVVNSKAADEIIKQKYPYTHRELDDSDIEKLYRHGLYLSGLYVALLKRDRNTDFGFSSSENRDILDRVRYDVYLELCDFGLKELATNLQQTYSSK